MLLQMKSLVCCPYTPDEYRKLVLRTEAGRKNGVDNCVASLAETLPGLCFGILLTSGSFDCEVSECYAAPMLPQLMRANCGVFCVPQVTKKHGLCKDVAITKQALKPRSMSLFGPF